MASKRRFSFRWRLFLPMVIMTWIIIAVMMVFQYKREKWVRTDSMDRQLRLISNRIVDAYENDVELEPFMVFLERYFENSPLEDVLVSLYNERGDLLYAIGDPLDNTTTHRNIDDVTDSSGQPLFFADIQKSTDGKRIVHTAMPFTLNVTEALHIDGFTFWLLIALLTGGVTMVAYYSSGFLMRNIKMLSEFANNANNIDVAFDETKLSHDELGDISRQIIKLYRERGLALERSEREHQVALHAVEEKSRMKRQLTNNINHELKTPVGVIRGYLETVLSSNDMDDKTRDYFLQRALDNVGRLCNLLNDVSAMARLEDGSGKIPVTEINFHDLVYTIHNDLSQAGALGKMVFDFNVPLDCNIKGNANLLVSSVSNLVKNAVLHSHGTKMELDLVAESQKYYTFSFWDNGLGVDESHLPHLFERFYRIDAGRSRKSGGTGLGLPIVKNTIEALGGTIAVHNRSAGGLEFVFTLQKWY